MLKRALFIHSQANTYIPYNGSNILRNYQSILMIEEKIRTIGFAIF